MFRFVQQQARGTHSLPLAPGVRAFPLVVGKGGGGGEEPCVRPSVCVA